MNCVGLIMYKELLVVWEEFKINDKLKVVVIIGVGDWVFCSGGDLKFVR